MNMLEIGSLKPMLGKAVEVDGCCVGYLADMVIEDSICGNKIHLEIAPTPETIKKMSEYPETAGKKNEP